MRHSGHLWRFAGILLVVMLAAAELDCQSVAISRGSDASARFHIVEAGDFIVPGSVRNTIRYTCPAAWQSSEVRLEVIDGAGRTVRVDRHLKNGGEADAAFVQYQWNGCADAAGRAPLAEGRYRLRLVAALGDVEQRDEIAALVQRRKLPLEFSDSESYPGSSVSGSDPAAVTRENNRVIITQSFKDEPTPPVEIMAYHVIEEYPGVVVFLQSSPGVDYPFYITPTHPTDGGSAITYQLKVKVSEGGLADRAGNTMEFGDNHENVLIMEFGLSEKGKTHLHERGLLE